MYPKITDDQIETMQGNIKELVNTLGSEEFRNMSAAE
jgi:hypothetical protein